MSRRPMALRLLVLAALAGVIVLAAVAVAGPGASDETKPPPSEQRSLLEGIPQDGIVLGSPDAPVTIVEFADLQCPFCAEYHHNVFPDLVKRYVRTGKVRLELRLLRFLGPDSDRLARTAVAAAAQDRMWQFVGLAFDRQGPENSGYATDDFINALAADAGLKDADAGRAADAVIRQGERAARTAHVDSTPTFFIGRTGGRLTHFAPSDLTPDVFLPRVKEELAK